MYKLLKRCCQLFLLLLAAVVLFFNAGFYFSPDVRSDEGCCPNKDVHHQLTYLKKKIHAGAAENMQHLFPEGHLFMNALYGLTWTELNNEAGDEALNEIDWALAEMNSETGRRIFNEDLPLPYGAFYRGWTNYLTGKRLEADIISQEITGLHEENFRLNCQDIAKAYAEAESPYLQSYHGGIWPADNLLAIASLASYDRYFDTLRYQPLIEGWLAKVKKALDPATGLIPHVVYEGAPPQGARGSSQSLMLSLLPEIDSAFAAEQFALYQQYFVGQRLGLPGIREYPKGMEGTGDIDSGPVIWGIGGAASVVGQRAAYVNGDYELYKGLRNSIEAFGFGFTWFGKKRYVFGQLPIADAFIAWSNSVEKTPADAPSSVPWPIHLVSLVLLLLILWVGFKL
ncbi:hypothetical protein FUA23_08290 [Neolewinella aurantiaca]|uniref:Uncharacterized protein n=1 Tax=Neolewinella aurantiaca TaxID=2602767 RepID=A0A5C7FG71_9BACT|nr:hypothetical protein [Neolewinella aurantiaca]TXF89947.1 hypothetical protein FUA23_08290 [Neolewinella aurantiaca]